MKTLLGLLLLLSLFARLGAAEPGLKVSAADKSLAITAEAWAKLPRTELTVTDPRDQKEHHYSGVAVKELLTSVGAPLGDKLRGAALQEVVTIRAGDGYAVVFALAEFDDAFSSRTILLADQEDGKPLPEGTGPLRLITPGDKHGARWVRQVTAIEVAPAAAVPATPVATPAKPTPAGVH